jgi:hypothetical protein
MCSCSIRPPSSARSSNPATFPTDSHVMVSAWFSSSAMLIATPRVLISAS